jgi:hypothetical protein
MMVAAEVPSWHHRASAKFAGSLLDLRDWRIVTSQLQQEYIVMVVLVAGSPLVEQRMK